MIIHTLQGPPERGLADALAEFEAQFTYPLGGDGSFRIAHNPNYPLFFQAMGEGAVLVAERDGQVLGTQGGALRRLQFPTGDETDAGYLGDLKILPSARGGMALLRLARAAQTLHAQRSEAVFTIVMDGTPAKPSAYTGRLGIPAFVELGHVTILRVRTVDDAAVDDDNFHSTAVVATKRHRHLSLGRYATPAGDSAARSEMLPQWLVLPDGSACGLVEDTRRAKRLLLDDGELISAHLSNFAYRSPADGAALLRAAARLAARNGYPNIFVAISTGEAGEFCWKLAPTEVTRAAATIYGYGTQPGIWNINTAEI